MPYQWSGLPLQWGGLPARRPPAGRKRVAQWVAGLPLSKALSGCARTAGGTPAPPQKRRRSPDRDPNSQLPTLTCQRANACPRKRVASTATCFRSCGASSSTRGRVDGPAITPRSIVSVAGKCSPTNVEANPACESPSPAGSRASGGAGLPTRPRRRRVPIVPSPYLWVGGRSFAHHVGTRRHEDAKGQGT